MSTPVIQTSFAAGELSPTMYARVDLAKYHVGAALLENFFVDYRGGAATRPGTEFVCRCKTDDSPARLIPFQFSTIQTYVLEFGDFYMRVIKDGAPVLEPSIVILGVSQSNPGVVTVAAGHGLNSSDTIYLSIPTGMTQLNQVTAVINNVTANNFSLADLDGNPINTTSYSAYTSGGTLSRVFTLTTPYAAEDLAMLKFTQSADVMTLTHPDYAPQELSRLSHYQWTIAPVAIGTNILPPTSPVATKSAAGAAVYAYVITTVGEDGQESVASARADESAAVNISVTAGHIDISWVAAAGAKYYNIYKAHHLPTAGTIPVGVNFGWIGDATGTGFVDNNITPDFTLTPPLATNPFEDDNNPGAVGFFQQRRVFAASNDLPETFWMSQPGAFSNFDVSNPVKGDDAITGTLASRQVNNIKFMIGMPGGLILLTGGGAWQVSGGAPNAAIEPTTAQATPQAYNGCSDVEPIPINYDILYIQSKGTVVRDLAYNFYTNIYTGTDISLLSNHLFTGFTIVEWAYAEEPFKTIWMVRDDGQLISLTFLKEQEVYGYAHSQTLGLFKSVTSIQEGIENAVYFVVRRYVNGRWTQFIERMASRHFDYGVEDAWCVDCGLQNTLTYPAAGLTASSSSGSVTFTADTGVFASGDVGKVLRMNGGIATITAFTNSTHLVGTWTRNPTNTLSNSLPVPALADEWSLTAPITTLGNLGHLEGMTVAVLGDGNVFPLKVVTNGQITLEHSCTKITVGIPFRARLQTLYLDVGEPTIQGKRKKIAALTARVDQARGLKMGSTFSTLTEFKQRNTQPMGQPINLFTGDQRIIMDPSWNVPGQICIQIDDPLPATILGVIPEIVVGDTK